MVVEAGDDGGDGDPGWDSGICEFADGAEVGSWGGGARFESAGECGVEGGDREGDGGGFFDWREDRLDGSVRQNSSVLAMRCGNGGWVVAGASGGGDRVDGFGNAAA